MDDDVVLYAVLRDPLSAPLPGGIAGEELAQVLSGGVVGVVGHAPPTDADIDGVLAHARVVEELAARADAVLPARWGSRFSSRAAVQEALAADAAALAQALEEVSGCAEIGVRGLVPSGEPRAPAATGRAYLEERREEARRRDAVVARVHTPLEARARQARFDAGGGSFSAAYLVPSSEVEAFLQAIDELAAANPELAIVAVGPWPPYSFGTALEA